MSEFRKIMRHWLRTDPDSYLIFAFRLYALANNDDA